METLFAVFLSVDGILGKGALVVLSKLSRAMSVKKKNQFCKYGVGKRSNRNCGREVGLMNDPQSSTPQSPVGKGARMGSGIRNRVGRLRYPLI